MGKQRTEKEVEDNEMEVVDFDSDSEIGSDVYSEEENDENDEDDEEADGEKSGEEGDEEDGEKDESLIRGEAIFLGKIKPMEVKENKRGNIVFMLEEDNEREDSLLGQEEGEEEGEEEEKIEENLNNMTVTGRKRKAANKKIEEKLEESPLKKKKETASSTKPIKAQTNKKDDMKNVAAAATSKMRKAKESKEIKQTKPKDEANPAPRRTKTTQTPKQQDVNISGEKATGKEKKNENEEAPVLRSSRRVSARLSSKK